MSWSELSSRCAPDDDAASPGAEVHLGTGADDDLREEAVLTLFSQGGYGAVRVIVENDEIGVLTRDAVLEYMGSALHGFGAGDGASLPGSPLGFGIGQNALVPGEPLDASILQHWRCPVPGCPEPDIWIVGFDPDDPPTCATHTDTFLERVG
jgi:hypothetical protein